MPEILGSGKCQCLNENEKERLGMALFRATQVFTDRMRLEKDPEEKESYNEHILEFEKIKEKVRNTPEC